MDSPPNKTKSSSCVDILSGRMEEVSTVAPLNLASKYVEELSPIKWMGEVAIMGTVVVHTWTGKMRKLFPVRESQGVLNRLEKSGNFTKILDK